ncbi:hypothetical protein ACFSHQ_09890 [Gemmobacter lanyuensis]
MTENAYHGVTLSVAEFSPSLGAGVPLGAHVRTVPPPDARRFGGDAAGALAPRCRRRSTICCATASSLLR